MRKIFLILLLTVSAILIACNSSNSEVELLRKENELGKKEAELAKKEFELARNPGSEKPTPVPSATPAVANLPEAPQTDMVQKVTIRLIESDGESNCIPSNGQTIFLE